MKHLITFICLGMLSIAGTQNVQAQTKEETIAWIKEKLSKSLVGGYLSYRSSGIMNSESKVTDVKLESINECEFVVSYKAFGESRKVYYPTSIKSIDFYSGDGYTTGYLFKYSAQVARNVNLVSNEEYYSSHPWGIEIAEREENLRERLEKALKHLATFCPKKKEAF